MPGEIATIKLSSICSNLQNETSKILQFILIVVNETNIPLVLVGYEMIIANSALYGTLTICHLISNVRLLFHA